MRSGVRAAREVGDVSIRGAWPREVPSPFLTNAACPRMRNDRVSGSVIGFGTADLPESHEHPPGLRWFALIGLLGLLQARGVPR